MLTHLHDGWPLEFHRILFGERQRSLCMWFRFYENEKEDYRWIYPFHVPCNGLKTIFENVFKRKHASMKMNVLCLSQLLINSLCSFENTHFSSNQIGLFQLTLPSVLPIALSITRIVIDAIKIKFVELIEELFTHKLSLHNALAFPLKTVFSQIHSNPGISNAFHSLQ